MRLGHKTILTLLCSITSGLFLFSASFNLLRSRRRHLFHTKLLTIRVIMNFQYFLLFSYSSYVTLVLFFSVLPAHDYCLRSLISFTFFVGCSPPTVTEGWSWGKTRFSRILSRWAITLWRHTSTELYNGFATQSAIPSKRKADVPNVPIDIPTVLSPNIRKNAYAATAAVHLINACVVGISKGN